MQGDGVLAGYCVANAPIYLKDLIELALVAKVFVFANLIPKTSPDIDGIVGPPVESQIGFER